MSGRYVVSAVDDLPPGDRRIVPVGGRGGIGVFNVGGRFYALRNRCPHKGGPLCRGRLRPHVKAGEVYSVEHHENQVLKCAWHQWEFDLATGRALYDPALRVKTYRVEIEADQVILYLDGPESPSREEGDMP